MTSGCDTGNHGRLGTGGWQCSVFVDEWRVRKHLCSKIPNICVCLHTCESCVQQTRRENSLTAAWEWGSIALIKQLLSQQTNTNAQKHTQRSWPSICAFMSCVCVCYRGYCHRLKRECVCVWLVDGHICMWVSPSFVRLHCQIVSILMLFAQHLGRQLVVVLVRGNVCVSFFLGVFARAGNAVTCQKFNRIVRLDGGWQ